MPTRLGHLRLGGSSGQNHSVENHYNTQAIAEIMKLPVAQLAGDDCALLL
jgi:hypothetical protein